MMTVYFSSSFKGMLYHWDITVELWTCAETLTREPLTIWSHTHTRMHLLWWGTLQLVSALCVGHQVSPIPDKWLTCFVILVLNTAQLESTVAMRLKEYLVVVFLPFKLLWRIVSKILLYFFFFEYFTFFYTKPTKGNLLVGIKHAAKLLLSGYCNWRI